MADLVTLQRLKTSHGLNPAIADPTDDKNLAALSVASAMIRNYTGLKFELGVNPPETRDFYYNGSGYLDLDECHTITSVTTKSGYTTWGDVPRTLTVDEWLAHPLNTPVKFWLTLPAIYGYGGGSPQMGFTRNLDTMPWASIRRPDIVSVTATYGWAAIPDDVQQAAIWTAMSLVESPKGTQYQSESIENYSRTRGPGTIDEAMPVKVQALLQPYIIPRVE
jgi:hypothetical protein